MQRYQSDRGTRIIFAGSQCIDLFVRALHGLIIRIKLISDVFSTSLSVQI